MMTLPIVNNPSLDPFTAWQDTNGAILCDRMSAIISAADCERNRNQTYVDCRCKGCGGLENQHGYVIPNIRPDFEWDNNQNEGFDVLDEIIDSLYEDPAPGDDFDDVELDIDDETLLKLFPELAMEEDDGIEKLFAEYQEPMPRYAVYHGRCKRCGTGYMENTREWHDDNVFHCLECGWRTGPEYESNRAMKGVAP